MCPATVWTQIINYQWNLSLNDQMTVFQQRADKYHIYPSTWCSTVLDGSRLQAEPQIHPLDQNLQVSVELWRGIIDKCFFLLFPLGSGHLFLRLILRNEQMKTHAWQLLIWSAMLTSCLPWPRYLYTLQTMCTHGSSISDQCVHTGLMSQINVYTQV